ncbi:MAG: AAA family ATPase [Actinomycetota bacterium]|nr:AAA family ATPase [Actinomycetota bacterium]
MITRLQISGFKNLHDVELRLGPFTCIAGLNGVGKSNVFDAIRFLSLLAKHPITEAVQLLRETKGRTADPRSLFTAFGDYRAEEMRFSADLILRREVEDDFGVSSSAAISTVRYTVAFRVNQDEKPDRLELVEEKLLPIAQEQARRSLGFKASPAFKRSAVSGRRAVEFISTIQGAKGPQIKVRQEGHGGRLVPAPKSSRTVLGGLASSDFPTLLATHREMESWQTLLLEPTAMRAPADYHDARVVNPRGGNLPAAIERLRRQESRPGQVYAQIGNRLAELLDDVEDLRVVDDEKTETLTLEVQNRGGVFHAARSLSDGTLRFLVLATLAIDPEATGVICLEEAENGIHPQRVEAMVALLRDIAVDPDHAAGPDNPLRQVLVNTHSPLVVQHISADDIVYLETEKIVIGGQSAEVATTRVPSHSWRAAVQKGAPPILPGHLLPYFKLTAGSKTPEQLWLPFETGVRTK